MGQQLHFDQYINNQAGGKVEINNRPGRPNKPPAQSKGDPKSIRFKPTDENDFMRAARAERVSFNEYIERTGQIGVHFSLSEVEFMVKNTAHFRTLFDNWDLLQPLLEKLDNG
ncbi:MAG: hypothetical protein HGJ94_17280 [Desulfosarcina sp.]|nr:hypothetical protein [Desulfosarcina sp.]MBC2742108.1 hypothetical protein [Desulfosarcina sp.]MBC2765021.1 hypothetical protein [Desulfosarcina sp.]